MGINYFIFDGVSSLDYGVYIGGQGTYNAPQRDITKVSIPGRNGDLIMDNGHFNNIRVAYNIVVMDKFKDKTDAIREWLLKPRTYVRLEDTYHPGEFRMAMLSGGIEFETSAFNRTGRATVIFDCKPQRFIKSGEIFFFPLDLAGGSEAYASAKVFNPKPFDSMPIIRVYPNEELPEVQQISTVIFGEKTFVIRFDRRAILNLTDVEYVDIDCELMDCYYGDKNCNSLVEMTPGGDFPVFTPGVNEIKWNKLDNATSIQIAGRWWTI